jgi:hypothetical protein
MKDKLEIKKGNQMKEFEFKMKENKSVRIEATDYAKAEKVFSQYARLGFPKGEILFSVSLLPIVAFSNADGGWNYR